MRNIVYGVANSLISLSKKLLKGNDFLIADAIAYVIAFLVGGVGVAIIMIYELIAGEEEVMLSDIDYNYYIDNNENIKEAYIKGQLFYNKLVTALEEEAYIRDDIKVKTIIEQTECMWIAYDKIYKLEKIVREINEDSKTYALIKTIDVTYEGPHILLKEYKKDKSKN